MKVTDHVKELHTAIFTGLLSCGKIRLVLDLIDK